MEKPLHIQTTLKYWYLAFQAIILRKNSKTSILICWRSLRTMQVRSLWEQAYKQACFRTGKFIKNISNVNWIILMHIFQNMGKAIIKLLISQADMSLDLQGLVSQEIKYFLKYRINSKIPKIFQRIKTFIWQLSYYKYIILYFAFAKQLSGNSTKLI